MRAKQCVFSLIAFLVCGSAQALNVQVTKLRSDSGNIILMVFPQSSAADYPTRYDGALVTKRQAAADGGTFTIDGLQPGRYAIRVHHDENGNGVVDKRMVFIPNEGLGFSRGARLSLRGAPSFEDAAIEVENDSHLTIEMSYP